MVHSILLCGSIVLQGYYIKCFIKGHAQKTSESTASSTLGKVGCYVIYDRSLSGYYVTYGGLCSVLLPEVGLTCE